MSRAEWQAFARGASYALVLGSTLFIQIAATGLAVWTNIMVLVLLFLADQM